MYKLLLILFVFTGTITRASANYSIYQGPGDSIKPVIEEHIGGDSEDPEGDEEEELEEEDFLDADTTTTNLYLFKFLQDYAHPTEVPAQEHYELWNTRVIHPYQFDVKAFKDTLKIELHNEETGFYAHPYLGYVTSNFGPRRHRHHYGIDIKLETGDCINNAFEGIVRIAQYSRTYGNVVVVRHHNGLETIYAHLSEINVRPGDHVKPGDLLGLGGNTGRSTGPHLHFEVRFKGKPINPNDLIDFSSGNLKSDILEISPKTFGYLNHASTKAVKYHVVRRGDNLGKIARKYGVSVNRLCKLNKISSRTTLRPGRRLKVA